MGNSGKIKASRRSRLVRSTSDPDLTKVNDAINQAELFSRRGRNQDRYGENSRGLPSTDPTFSKESATPSSSIIRQNTIAVTTGSSSSQQSNANTKPSNGGLRIPVSKVGAAGGKCPHCNVRLKWPNGLRKHVENIHNRRYNEFHCEKCPFKHKSKKIFDEHQNVKHHTCPYCKGIFSRLEQHMPSCSRKASAP